MIKGQKILLESVDSSHLEQLRKWRNNPNLRKYFREYREISDEMQRRWFEKITTDKDQVNFSIKEKNTENLIGHCGLYYIDWRNRTAEFEIYLGDKESRGKGYGSEALRQLCGYGFNELNLNRIWCEVYSNNQSLNMYRHIGFVDEGILRQNYYCEGQYLDSYILSMLQSEYKEKYKNEQ